MSAGAVDIGDSTEYKVNDDTLRDVNASLTVSPSPIG